MLGYEAFQYGPYRQSWSPGFYQGVLPDGVTRYITNGAGVSAPSENLGFYFSGMRSPDWGPIYYEDSSANVSANTMIQVDMSVMRSEKWTNITLPDNIPPRANAELVWIPVSDQGVLVAIGGVTAPEEIWAGGLNSSQTSQSREQSPGFMTSLPVYDIASAKWYVQQTTGDAPGQLTEFCSVVAVANDSSSFNVYIYGGYDGLNADDLPSDDVWILSIPSFTWVKAYSGTSSHGRSGHRCVTPYPDQMIIIGGVHQNQASCVEGGIIQVFNLNTLQFQNTYDPATWSEYAVPAVLAKAIGGSAQGGSSKTAAWSDNALGGVFSQKYSRQISRYYPYKSDGSSDALSPSKGGSSGIGKGAIIGISIAAVVLLILLILLILLLVRRRRRRIRSSASEKSSSSGSSQSRVSRWLNGASCATTPKYQSTSTPPEVHQVPYSSVESEPTPPLQPQRHEMASTERPKPPYELATPYNNLDHPRHSGIVDYAYNPKYGHTHSNTNSNSSGEYQPSPLTSLGNGSGNGNGVGNGVGTGASPLRSVRFPTQSNNLADHSSSSSNYSSTGTSETLGWPLPGSQNTWRSRNPTHRLGHDRDRASDSSSVQPIIEERAEDDSRVRDSGGAYPYHQPNESSSSGIGTLPSPSYAHDGSMPRDEEHRRSLFDTISPVSPSMGRH